MAVFDGHSHGVVLQMTFTGGEAVHFEVLGMSAYIGQTLRNNYLTTGSEFFALQPGKSTLTFINNGTVIDMTSATFYLVWKHRVSGDRGTEPFTAVTAAQGKFKVYYPAAMQETAGTVDAQIMASIGDDRYISSRVFSIRVEPVLVGGTEHQDGFTPFIEAIHAYEEADALTHAAPTK